MLPVAWLLDLCGSWSFNSFNVLPVYSIVYRLSTIVMWINRPTVNLCICILVVIIRAVRNVGNFFFG